MRNIEIGLGVATIATAIIGGYTREFNVAAMQWSRIIVSKKEANDLKDSGRTKIDLVREVVSNTNWDLVDALTPVREKILYQIFMLSAWLVTPSYAAILFWWWTAPLLLVLNYLLSSISRKFFPPSTAFVHLERIVEGLHAKKFACEKKGDLLSAAVYEIDLTMIRDYLDTLATEIETRKKGSRLES